MKKRLLALLLVLIMLVAMISGCSNNETGDNDGDDKNGSNVTPNGDDNNDDNNDDGDSPDELEPLVLTFLQSDGNIKSYAEAINADYATLRYLDEMALEQNNLVVERSPVLQDAYSATISGHLAAGTLPDAFYSTSITEDMFNEYAPIGMFAELHEVLEHSNGLASNLLLPGGDVTYIRALFLMEDGSWYRKGQPDGNGSYLNLSDDTITYANNWPLHTWYNLTIRRDWLNKCNLEMPQTTEEFKNALIAFQENDTNNNGTKDERAWLSIGRTAVNDVFQNGVAQWFGLPTGYFAMDPATGEIENAVLAPTYIDYITYMKELYDAGLANTNEGGAWTYSVSVATNTASVYVQYPERMMQSSCESATGDPDAQYDQMPIIQAVEGVKPIIIGQSATASNANFAFNSKANYDAAAAYLDFIYSEVFYMTLMYGLEGWGWEYDSNGNFVMLTISDPDEDYSYGDAWHYLCYNFYPQIQIGWVWDPLKNEYDSFQSALDNGEPYTWKFETEEVWKENNAIYNWDNYSPLKQYYEMIIDMGMENVTVKLNTTYGSPATNEEAEVISMYRSDLTTFLDEMTTSYIVGSKDIADYETDLQFAYDNLGLEAYMAAQQGKTNRYFEALGLEPFAG